MHKVTIFTQTKYDDNDEVIARTIFRHPPFFVTFMSIFQLVTFTYYALIAHDNLSLLGPVPFKSNLIYDPYRRYEAWRYLTYMFIHAGYWHISFNILVQLAVGVTLEAEHGFNAIFVIYIGGVIGGALGNSIADPHSYLAGASGGCYALIAAHLANLIINWKESETKCCKLIAVLSFAATIAFDIGAAIYERHARYSLKSIAYRTSYGGHLAGALTGLLLGLVVLHNVRVHRWELTVRKAAVTIYAALALLAIAWNLFNPDYFPLPDVRALDWSQSPFRQDREY